VQARSDRAKAHHTATFDTESTDRMVILAALLIFLIAKGFVTLLRRLHTADLHVWHRRLRARRAAAVQGTPSVDVDQELRVWTALDELQLNRLLKDAAP
jgi:hypothetical protein